MIKNFKSFDSKIEKAKSEIESILHILVDDKFEVELLELNEENDEEFLIININYQFIYRGIKYPFKQIEHLFRGECMEEFLDRLQDICHDNGLIITKVVDEEKLAHLTLKTHL